MDEQTKDLIYEMFMSMKKELQRTVTNHLDAEFYTFYDAFVATDDAEKRDHVMKMVMQLSSSLDYTHKDFMTRGTDLLFDKN